MFADEAASIADVAADEAAMPEADIASEAGVIVDGVLIVDVADGVVMAGGVVVVVVTSSFLLQAAKDTAVARLTIRIAVFILLLGGF